MASHHPEGWRRSPGGRILYWLRSSRYGVLCGLSFVSTGYQLRPRDEAIGWSPQACQAHIGRVLCNNRFLLLPSVRVHGLASQALQLATSCIADDWAYYYQVRPLLLQTFVAPEYRAPVIARLVRFIVPGAPQVDARVSGVVFKFKSTWISHIISGEVRQIISRSSNHFNIINSPPFLFPVVKSNTCQIYLAEA